MKRFFGLLIAILALTLVIVACGSGDDRSETAGGSESAGDGESVVTFTAFAPQQVRVENMDTNWFTQHVEEKLNIDIIWDLAPAEGADERKQLLLASGDYPEVFLQGAFTKEEQLRYSSQGVLIPLNDLIKEHAPNIQRALETVENYKNEITAPDGNIYALPHMNECYHCTYSQKMWINTQWLDNLGLDMPTTTDEFYEALKAFKEDDPNGNGEDDEIPLSGFINSWRGNVDGFLMNPFIYNNSEDYFRMVDGRVDLVANKPEWRDGLEYMHMLYSEGLIDPSSFTQDEESLRQLANSGEYPKVGAFTAGHLAMIIELTDEEDAWHRDYAAVPPLIGPDNVQNTAWYPSMGPGQFAITDKATEEQAIAAIRLADYMCTDEGAIRADYGPEGEYWRFAEEGELDYFGEQAKYVSENTSTVQTQNLFWDQMGPAIKTHEFRHSFAQSQDVLSPEGYELRLFQATQLYEPHRPDEVFPLNIFMNASDAEEAARLRTTINDYIEENMVAFITGNRSIEQEWDAYVKGLDDLGLNRYLEIYQNAYDAIQQ